MLSVHDLTQSQLQKHIDFANAHFSATEQIYFAFINNFQNFVIAGPPKSLHGLSIMLRHAKAGSGDDNSKIPYSKRKPMFSHSSLPITAPFHSKYLEDATATILEDVKVIEIIGRNLRMSVHHPSSGKDLNRSSSNIIPDMVHMMTEEVVNWPLTKFVRCRLQIILADRQDGINSTVGFRPELFPRAT